MRLFSIETFNQNYFSHSLSFTYTKISCQIMSIHDWGWNRLRNGQIILNLFELLLAWENRFTSVISRDFHRLQCDASNVPLSLRCPLDFFRKVLDMSLWSAASRRLSQPYSEFNELLREHKHQLEHLNTLIYRQLDLLWQICIACTVLWRIKHGRFRSSNDVMLFHHCSLLNHRWGN